MSFRARSVAGGGVLVAGYLVLLLANVCDFAAGPDSSGYLGQARMLRSGATSIRVAPVFEPGLDPSLIYLFTPYGFMRGPVEGTMVPTYPVGTSLHLAAGAVIGGWRAGPFAVVPLAAIACLLLTVFIGRRIGLATGWAIVAAAILAAFPIFIAQAVQPVSDVLATLWALAAIACALRSDEHWRWAAACGAAFAIGVAVRPTNVLLALPLLLALRCRWPRLIAAGAAAMPFALALVWYYDVLYGSPLNNGYGGVRHILSFGSIPPCLRPQTTWLIAAATPLLFPGGLFVALNRRVSGWHRALLLSWFGVFFLFYVYYDFCPNSSSTRFLLPALPALIIGLVSIVAGLSGTRRIGRVLAVVCVLAVLTREVVMIGRMHVLRMDSWEAIYPQTVEWVEQHAPANAVVLSAITSGAFHFHSERQVVRWDQLTPETTARLQSSPRFAGPWYAVVSEVEGGLPALRARVPGEWQEAGRIRDVTIWRRE